MTVLSIDICKANLECIQEIVDAKCEQEPSLLLETLNNISSLLGLCAQTSASLEYHYQVQMSMHLPNALKMKFSPSIQKSYAESCIPELMYLIQLCGRLNSALVHRIDALRSMLSYEKQERFFSNQNC